jgi:hypothetical protein
MTITFLLLLLAFICFVIAATSIPIPKVNLIGLGLALWVLAQLVTGIKI